MAGGVRTVKIKFDGDAKGLERVAKDGAKAMSRWHQSATQLGVAGGLALDRIGRALFGFAKDSVQAFAEAEESQARLTDAFARFPKLANVSIGALQKLNQTLATKTKFDDDAFASGEAVLAQFKLSGRTIERLTPLLADYAAKTGRSLPDAATVLGKAFLGQTKPLKELGINYKATGNRAKDLAAITKALQEKVGGFAEKEGKSAAGRAAILANQFGELKESLGEKLLPVLKVGAEWGLKTLDWISKNSEIIGPLAAVIGTVVAIQWAWNIAMAANPIGLVVIAIAALVAGIVWVATKTQFFQTLWRVSWGWIKKTALDFWNWFKTIPDQLGTLFSKIGGFIVAPFRAAFNFVAKAWNNTIGSLSWTVPDWVPFGLGGKTISAPKLPTFHRGGIVPGASDAIVRAKGGEGIFTREQMAALGGPGTVEVHVFIGDQELRDMIDVRVQQRDRNTRRRVLAGAGAR